MLSVILGCSGTVLSDRERAFFSEVQPAGYILFGRNIADPRQLRALIEDLRGISGEAAPVLIDQEGGRVQRLRPPHWRAAPPAGRFAALYEADRPAALEAAQLNARLMAEELAALGITVNCAPVLDLVFEVAHDIVGDRSFGGDPDQVAALGGAVCRGLLSGGVLPVIKHIPGHGRAREDSHLALPRVDADLEMLRALDFRPFEKLKDAPWAMTAHILYPAIDAERPATQSGAVISLIRQELGFDGLLISDDLSMKALEGGYDERALRSLRAGCDLVLHCNGDPEEMTAVVKGCGPLEGRSLARLRQGEEMRVSHRQPLRREETLERLEALLAGA